MALDLSQLQVDLRQYEDALRSLPEVHELALAADSPYLAARALGLQARACRVLGDPGEARRLYAEAAQLSEQAGDGQLAARFHAMTRVGTDDISALPGAHSGA